VAPDVGRPRGPAQDLSAGAQRGGGPAVEGPAAGGPAAGAQRGGGPAAGGPAVGAPVVGIVMGSDSDWAVMEAASAALQEFSVPHEVRVMSAHRTPRDMLDWAASAVDRGLRVVVAGAGGAAHLPGMVASMTPLPVIGVPVPLRQLDGLDSLLSIVQMPAGVPVATVSIGGARNAGLLAVRILAAADPALLAAMTELQQALADAARAKDAALQALRAAP